MWWPRGESEAIYKRHIKSQPFS